MKTARFGPPPPDLVFHYEAHNNFYGRWYWYPWTWSWDQIQQSPGIYRSGSNYYFPYPTDVTAHVSVSFCTTGGPWRSEWRIKYYSGSTQVYEHPRFHTPFICPSLYEWSDTVNLSAITRMWFWSWSPRTTWNIDAVHKVTGYKAS